MIIANGNYKYPVKFVKHPQGIYTRFQITDYNTREKNLPHQGFFPIYIFVGERLDLEDGDKIAISKITRLHHDMHRKKDGTFYPQLTMQCEFEIFKAEQPGSGYIDSNEELEDDLPF